MFTKTALALATVLSLTAVAEADNLSGWGTRDWTTFHSSFMGDITLKPNGTLEGHFTIITNNDNEEQVVCRYLRFKPTRIGNGSWIFDGWGQCLSESTGYYAVSNRFVIIDYGAGPNDYIDVNYYGAVGPSVPGGNLQSGDMISVP